METPPDDNRQLSSFPQPVRQLMEVIDSSGPLGTSAVIGMYGRALEMLAVESTARSGGDLAGQALNLISYFLKTRGRFTVAVVNSFAALRSQLDEMRTSDRSVEEVSLALRDFRRRLASDRQGRMDAIAAAGANQLSGADSLLLYDYSSTVFKVVAALAKENGNLQLVVPESRTCDGGLPILRHGKELTCRQWLVPDAALAFAMPKCDAVLVGVETFFRDGSFTNTVGSLTTAVVAKHFAVPFFAVTDLSKADHGQRRDAQPERTFCEPLAGHSELLDGDRIGTTYPPLEKTPGKLVTAYITEKGVLRPERVWSTALTEVEGE
ncbi:MAG: hypothetical protein F4047_16140 [Caldilineaceae bacterium SB0670_bin_27]|uniref:Translation initiation factor eIF-2B n=1 Tax=Caldilineaceae bacterium SB0664_bin_27 TaxID=2605260 RepID=A0A6B0YPF0_9CHLR|nr:hypothetical protein [Caldilineaceae bacterium SB0664_bin_27]MYJ79636.1 hypothetical protein [Caldilineaceae bacterium SB0670_bin_27]